MRKFGWSLLGLGFVAVLLSVWSGRENALLLTILVVSFALGSLILLTSFALRLYRGEVRLRPRDAAKMAVILFLLMMSVRLLLATLIFPDSDKAHSEHILASALFAIVLSLYQTAYRKPA